MTRQRDNRPLLRLRSALAVLTVSAGLVAGCGSSSNTSNSASSSSSKASTSTTTGAGTTSAQVGNKPAYCTSLSSLEQSLKALKGVEVAKNGTGSLKAAVAQVETNAKAVVNDAQTAFANETADLKNSIDTLSSSVRGFASPPTSSQVKALRPQVSAVGTATKNLATSAAPRCG